MVEALVGALGRLNADRDMRVAILTGAGKGFSSGGNLQKIGQPGELGGAAPADTPQDYIRGISASRSAGILDALLQLAGTVVAAGATETDQVVSSATTVSGVTLSAGAVLGAYGAEIKGRELVLSGATAADVLVYEGGVTSAAAGGVVSGGRVASGGLLSRRRNAVGHDRDLRRRPRRRHGRRERRRLRHSRHGIGVGGVSPVRRHPLGGLWRVDGWDRPILRRNADRRRYADLWRREQRLPGGKASGAGRIVQSGAGALVLAGQDQSFTGVVVVGGGAVQLATAGALQSGTVDFASAASAKATLTVLATDPLVPGQPAPTLKDFASTSDTLDLASVTYVSGATASISGSVLSVVDGWSTLHFNLTGSVAASYGVTTDGSGGTRITAIAARSSKASAVSAGTAGQGGTFSTVASQALIDAIGGFGASPAFALSTFAHPDVWSPAWGISAADHLAGRGAQL